MKKRVISCVCTLALIMGMLCAPVKNSEAADVPEQVDGSYLTMEESSQGSSTAKTRGIYLMGGDSEINRLGVGKLAAGGNTYAAKTVSTVSVTVIVERLSGGSWVRVTSWSATNYNASAARASKSLSVGSGYYYRARSIHSANSDSCTSYTNGVWV